MTMTRAHARTRSRLRAEARQPRLRRRRRRRRGHPRRPDGHGHGGRGAQRVRQVHAAARPGPAARAARGWHGALDGGGDRSLPTREVARRLGLLPQQPIVPEGVSVLELVERGRHPHHGLFRTLEPRRRGGRRRGPRAHRPRAPRGGPGRQPLRRPAPAGLAGHGPRPGDAGRCSSTSRLVPRHRAPARRARPRAGPCDDSGTTVVMVLHDLAMAARYADHLVAMRDGSVVARGTLPRWSPGGDRGGLRRHRHVSPTPSPAPPVVIPRRRQHERRREGPTSRRARLRRADVHRRPLVRADTPQFAATVVAVDDLGGGCGG